MPILVGFFAGLLFGLGLIVSSMVSPHKVKAFLDVAGAWDVGLAWVMIGAIAVTLPGYALLRAWRTPLFADTFHWPTRTDIDKRLVTGAVLFGFGWGLGGFCPGPVLAGLLSGQIQIIVVVVAMLAGFVCAPVVDKVLK